LDWVFFVHPVYTQYIWRNYEQIKQGELLPSYSPESLSSCLRSKLIQIKIHRSMILPVVVFGCKTWSLTLMKEQRHGQDMEDEMGRACDMYGGEAST
jgi:hypothetical protein